MTPCTDTQATTTATHSPFTFNAFILSLCCWVFISCSLFFFSALFTQETISQYLCNLRSKRKIKEAQQPVCVRAASPPAPCNIPSVRPGADCCGKLFVILWVQIVTGNKHKTIFCLRCGCNYSWWQEEAEASLLSLLIKRAKGKEGLTFQETPQAWFLSCCVKPICTHQ